MKEKNKYVVCDDTMYLCFYVCVCGWGGGGGGGRGRLGDVL